MLFESSAHGWRDDISEHSRTRCVLGVPRVPDVAGVLPQPEVRNPGSCHLPLPSHSSQAETGAMWRCAGCKDAPEITRIVSRRERSHHASFPPLPALSGYEPAGKAKGPELGNAGRSRCLAIEVTIQL